MRLNSYLTVVAGLLVAALPASAITLFERMAPGTLKGSGFTLSTRQLPSSRTEFKITRDLAKSHKPGRYAELVVRNGSAIITQCDVEGERIRGTITYRFEIGSQYVRDSVFTVTENLDDPQHPEEPKMVGGADDFEFRLADFAPKTAPGKTVR
jgi:hypothetical protein